MAFTLQIHIQVSDDVEKAVKRTKRQSQWTLLDPRTGRPVGWVTIFIFRIMTLITVIMIMINFIFSRAMKCNCNHHLVLAIDKAVNQTVINFWQLENK